MTNSEIFYFAIDKLVPNEENASRSHEFFDKKTRRNISFKFHYGKPTQVPDWVALHLLAAPEGFVVYDAHDQEVTLRVPEKQTGIILQHNEVVTTYDKLTLSALKDLAAEIRDFDAAKVVGKEAIINFLITKKKIGDNPIFDIEDDAAYEAAFRQQSTTPTEEIILNVTSGELTSQVDAA